MALCWVRVLLWALHWAGGKGLIVSGALGLCLGQKQALRRTGLVTHPSDSLK